MRILSALESNRQIGNGLAHAIVVAYNHAFMQKYDTVRHPLWRNLPNSISIGRLCATVILLGSMVFDRVTIFKWVLLGCLLSDVADGLIARALRLTSKLGAFLDSLADVATMFVAVLGILVFQQPFVAEHRAGLLLVVGFYIAEVVASLWRYGRVSSFHTVLARVAAFTGGVFVMSLFLWGCQDWLYQRTILVYLLAVSRTFPPPAAITTRAFAARVASPPRRISAAVHSPANGKT